MTRYFLMCGLVGLLGSAVATSSMATGTRNAGSAAEKPAAASTKKSTKRKPSPSLAEPADETTSKPVRTPALDPVTPAELAAIFGGKTWLWTDGAAYFAPGGRFVAWAGKDTAASFAKGTWSITPKGRVCFRANWVSRSGDGPSQSCFGHALRAGDLLQRREPNGEWYVFKHREADPQDEFHKLVDGDQAGADAKKIMAVVGRS
jgi:hypothetical protein